MTFTSANFKLFRKDAQDALAAVAKKYDISISLGNISYMDDSFTVKMTCAKTDAGDLDQKEFERFCGIYGLTKEDYGREFMLNGHRYKLTGLSVKSPKYSCIAEDLTVGKTYKLPAETVKRAFGSEELK